jgi:hypothetical protein
MVLANPHDYSKGKIYKLWSPSTDKVYIGSTIQTLKRRLNTHIWDAENGRSCSGKIIIAFNDYEMELLENFPCKTKKELNRREGEITLTFPSNVNIHRAGACSGTYKEYRDDPINKAVADTRRRTPEYKAVKNAHRHNPEVKAKAKLQRQKPEVVERTNARRRELAAEKRANL